MTERQTGTDGLTAQQLFNGGSGLTFDDVNILPAYSDISTADVILSSPLSHDFPLRMPVISSPMDTVTEHRTAIRMALHGGIGIIHFNLTPAEAAAQVRRVKRFEMGFIFDPVCRVAADNVGEAKRMKRQNGFSTIPITEDGTSRSRLLGMVTRGHVTLEEDGRELGEIMTPLSRLSVFTEAEVPSLAAARDRFRHNREMTRLVILKPDGSIHALVTRDDVAESGAFPNALHASNKQLCVGAAVSTQEEDIARVTALLEEGVDCLVVDSAQGGTAYAASRIRHIKTMRPDVIVIAGNVVTAAQARPLLEAGADALRVGMGAGSICTTQKVLGIGRAQLSAIYHVSRFASQLRRPIPVIADGGIRSPADMLKALAMGASTVMVGRYVAGCDETPGEVFMDGATRKKRYRGMGSASAIREGGDRRYGNVSDGARRSIIAQGIDADVPVSGSLDTLLPETLETLTKGLEYLGCRSIGDLHQKVSDGVIGFELRSEAARKEGDPHDVTVGPPSPSTRCT